MAKKIADPKKRRLIKIGLELLQEAVWLQGQGGITKAKVLDLRTKYGEQRAAQAQEAKELFERISRKLGSEEAKDIFTIASKRPRGSKYGMHFDLVLLLHANATSSPTRTARRAIELGLQAGAEALIKHIQILRRKQRKRPAAERDK